MKTLWHRSTAWVVLAVFCVQFSVGCASLWRKNAQEPPEPNADLGALQFTEFALGPGDQVEVEVYQYDELKRKISVPGSGVIFFPLVGEIDVKGLGVTELRRTIQDRLKDRIVDPQVSLSVTMNKSQKVYVLGQVKSPSVLTLDAHMRAAEAVSKSGGFTDAADHTSVVLVRNKQGNPDLYRLNLDEFFEGAKLGPNMSLQPGDVLYVPRTFVADMDAFFGHVLKALFPLVMLEQAIVLGPSVRDAVTGVSNRTQQTIIITPAVSP